MAKKVKETVQKKEDKKQKVEKTSKPIKKDKEEKTKNRMVRRFNKLRLKQSDLDGKKAIVYVGHLPKGFTEDELKQFFTQFGKITKIRLSRSKKTARSRGYGFLEFKEKAVAEIAVNTMNGYLMFGKKIECHIIESVLAHKDMFKNGNREWKFVPNQVIFRNKKNKTD